MDRMAGALTELGVGKGDRVTIFAHNGLDYLIAMFGAWRIGAIAALVNVKFADDLSYYFADHEPAVVIYTHDMAEPVRRAAAGAPSVRHLVCMDGPQEHAHSLPDLMAAGLSPAPDPWDEDAIAHLSYTSGTTGKPKGACLRHEPTVRATRCIAERLRIGGEDVSFGPTALSSSYQLVANLMPPLGRMATIHVMGRWSQASGYDAIEAAAATLFVANPTLLGKFWRKAAFAESRRVGFVSASRAAVRSRPRSRRPSETNSTCPWWRALVKVNLAASWRLVFRRSSLTTRGYCASVRHCPTRRCGSSTTTIASCRPERSARSSCAADSCGAIGASRTRPKMRRAAAGSAPAISA